MVKGVGMDMHRERARRVMANLRREGLSQMLVCDPLAIWYLTGYYVNPLERFLGLLLRQGFVSALEQHGYGVADALCGGIEAA